MFKRPILPTCLANLQISEDMQPVDMTSFVKEKEKHGHSTPQSANYLTYVNRLLLRNIF
jgi:hypothetical protein